MSVQKIDNYGDLKELLNSLTDEQLKQKVQIFLYSEPAKEITALTIFGEDLYYVIEYPEEGMQPLSDHEEAMGDDFDEAEIKLGISKGTIMFEK